MKKIDERMLPSCAFFMEVFEMQLKRFCLKSGCKELVSNKKYCDEHQNKVVEQHRKSAAKRGYDHRWRKARIRFLFKHPLCKHCFEQQNKLITATVVDHIIPHRGDMVLFWDEKNWQPLCETCHNIKTAKEDGGFGNG